MRKRTIIFLAILFAINALLYAVVSVHAALPSQVKSARMAGSTPGNQIDNLHNELESFIIDVFGFPDTTNITNGIFDIDATGRITQTKVPHYGAGPVGQRFYDTDSSTEFLLAIDGDYLWIYENTATWASPTWAQRFSLLLTNGAAKIYQNLTVDGALAVVGAATANGGETIFTISNDGTGSGLDADKLDGQEGSYYTKPEYLLVREEQTVGTDGGTFTQGAWRTRVLNTEVSDTGSDCALSSNQMTLEAGTYDVHITCPAYAVGTHRARLYNVTDGAAEMWSDSVVANNANLGFSQAVIRGRMILAAQKVMEVQHRCTVTNATVGLGKAGSFGGEYYTIVEMWKR